MWKGEVCVIFREPKAEKDNTNRGLSNFSYPAKTELNNCFIIYLYLDRTQSKRLLCKQDASYLKNCYILPYLA